MTALMVDGSPVHFGNPNGTVPSLMRRPPHSSEPDLRMMVGRTSRAPDATATAPPLRRSSQLFEPAGMPVASPAHWPLCEYFIMASQCHESVVA